MHRILKRQIRNIYGTDYAYPSDIGQLLKVVGKTYEDFENGQALVERTLDVSSAELTEINKKLRREKDLVDGKVLESTKELTAKVKELDKLNKLMIGRELRMLELKEEVKRLST